MADTKTIIEHLRQHQEYPATREQLIKSFESMADFSDDDKAWFADSLPDGTYEDADRVIDVLELETDGMGDMK